MEEAAASGGAPEEAPQSGLLQRVDAGIYRVETALVTLAALCMTITVFLDVVYRSFASPDSKLAEAMGALLGYFVDVELGTVAMLRDVVSPVVLVLLAFFAGWAIYAAARRRLDQPTQLGPAAVSGVVSVGLCYAFIQFVLRVPSDWVCGILLVAGCLGVAVAVRGSALLSAALCRPLRLCAPLGGSAWLA